MAAAPSAIRLTQAGAIAVMLVGAIGAKGAHHSVLPYDAVTATTIEGTVQRVLWQNPHTFIAIDVGEHRWTVESEGSSILTRLGWTSGSLKAGDNVTVTGARAKDGRRLMRCKTIEIGDRELPCFEGQTRGQTRGQGSRGQGSDPGSGVRGQTRGQTPERDDSRR